MTMILVRMTVCCDNVRRRRVKIMIMMVTV